MKKFISIYKNQYIVRVAMSEKMQGYLQKNNEKNIDFLFKNRWKIDEKVGCSALLSKNRKNDCPGTPIFTQSTIFGRFRDPLGEMVYLHLG